ncbi:uncharacterized protein EV420DRAFT_1484937 [Desarmillaria tabescens]|uniref:Uncharacterized protein n=1 Tax=Armillaria tabescens TaxID=1929756 RepID=A0AA39JII4_ARMTA|nr:uncharacterized protein EV420DRAFT_1484937 [Desarmillaria tabescens]KAK0443410.1 hypothetical protein EV420DRAFT_1484937 [Desarmillaria tabescens]
MKSAPQKTNLVQFLTPLSLQRWWTWPASFHVSRLVHTISAFIRELLEQWTMKLNELYTLLGAYRNRSMPSPWATNQQENVYRDICLLVNNQKDDMVKTFIRKDKIPLVFMVLALTVLGNISPSRLLYSVTWGCWTSDTGLTNFLTEAAPLIQGDSEGADTWFSDAFAALVQCNQILGLEVHVGLANVAWLNNS